MAVIRLTNYEVNLSPEELDQMTLALEYALDDINRANNRFNKRKINEEMIKYIVNEFSKMK